MKPMAGMVVTFLGLTLAGQGAGATSPTWSAGYATDAPARLEATVVAAVVDRSDNLILAGLASGPLSIGKECRFPEGLAKHPFLMKVAPSGRLSWCHPVGPITALTSVGNTLLAVTYGYAGATGSPTVVSIERDGRLARRSELRESHQVSVIEAGANGDLFFGGCDREWLGADFPGTPRVMTQHDGFVARANRDGKILWRLSVREKHDEGARGPEASADCVTSLRRSDRGGVFATGPFKGALALGEWKLSGNEGTFIARLAENGDLLWARRGASRLATASYDVRPGIAVDSRQHVIVAGIVPRPAEPREASGLLSVRSDGDTDWFLGIGSEGLCCEGKDLVVDSGLGRIFVAGRVARRSLQVGPETIDMSSADGFVAQVSPSGKVLAVQKLPGFVSGLFAVLPGRRGEWIVGDDRPLETWTGLFAHWSPRASD